MMRRFVYLVAENYKSRMCSLHRLDVSKHLFYPSAAEADAAPAPGAAAVIPRLERLPPPCISFQPSPTTVSSLANRPLFALVSPHSTDGNRVVSWNSLGHTVLYDADSHSVQTMPSMQGFTGIKPTIISTGRPGALEEDLYVLHSGFHVLRFGPDDIYSSFPGSRNAWHWESLPEPPLDRGDVRSHTVVDGGRTICLSSAPGSFGTYCFDTVEREWWQAGSWVLPFLGGAENVPDFDVWLGFSPTKNNHLCVTPDLSAMEQLIALERPLTVQHVLKHLDPPKNWFPLRSNLLSLGRGRFCVAKVFQEVDQQIDTGGEESESDLHHFLPSSEFVVLTGVELVATSASGGGKKLQALRVHKSLRYMFPHEVGVDLVSV